MTFEDIEQSRKDFTETRRHAVLKSSITTFVISVAVFALISIYVTASSKSVNPPSVFIMIPPAIVISLFLAIMLGCIKHYTSDNNLLYKKYQQNYVEYFITPTLKKFFTNVKYRQETEESFQSYCPFIPSAESEKITNYLAAKYKNINFEQCNLCKFSIFPAYSINDGMEIKFIGHYLCIDFNQSFKTDILICGKKYRYFPKSRIKRTLEYKRVHTDIPGIEKSYKIYGKKQNDIKQLVDSDFVSKLQKIDYIYNGNFMISFYGQECYVTFNDVDVFREPNPKKNINEAEEFAKIEQNIRKIIEPIELFNSKKYLKEAKQ